MRHSINIWSFVASNFACASKASAKLTNLRNVLEWSHNGRGKIHASSRAQTDRPYSLHAERIIAPARHMHAEPLSTAHCAKVMLAGTRHFRIAT